MKTITIEPKVLEQSKSSVNTIDLRIDKKEFEILTEDCSCIIDEVEFVKIIDLKTNMSFPVVDTLQSATTATPRKGIHKLVSRLFNRMAVLPLTLTLCLMLVLGVGNVLGQLVTYTPTSRAVLPTNTKSPSTNITAGDITTGGGISAGTCTSGFYFHGSDVQTNSTSNAATGGDYYEFTVAANSGYTATYTTVSLASLRNSSSTAVPLLKFSYKIGSGSFNDDASSASGGTGNCSSTGNTYTYNFTDFTTSQTVTFRIYIYNGSAANTSFRFGTITVGGSVTTSPTISTSGTLSAVSTNYGTATASPTSFTVSGSNLNGTAAVTVTPPVGFEVATSSDFSTTIGTSASALSLGTATSIVSTTIYVRLAATASVSGSPYSGNIVVAGGGASSQNVATVSSTVSKKALTITAGNQSVAYGTAVATVTGNGSYTPTGFVNSETSSVIGGSASYTTTYTTTTATGSNVATITPVTTSLTATNYSFTAANGNISVTAVVPSATSITGITPGNTQLGVAFSAPSSNGGASITNYEYSTNGGSSWTTPSPAITTSPFTISGLTNGTTYDVQIRAVNSAGSGTATGTTQGTPAAPSSPTISGAASATAFTTTYGTASAPQSFSVSGSALTGDITATAPTGFVVSSDGSSYNSTATFTQSGGSASGTLYVKLSATATVSGTYNSQNIVLSSTGASSVNISTAASGNSVSAKGLTITGISISNKTYDATTTATISGTAAYSGLVNGETFSVTGTPNATFTDKNVANGKSVTLVDYTAPSGNYSISQPTGLTANITAATLTLTGASVTSKTYDGTTAATITGTISGVISSDVVTLNGTGTFASANVGTGISVTSTSTLGGADAGNYSLTQPTGLTGQITLKSLTITATDVSKEMGVLLTGGAGSTAFTSSGLAGSETIGSVTITYGAAAGTTGQGATAGTYSGQVTPSAATGVTFNAANYSITYSSGSISVSGFTAGNLVINRIGNGSTALGNTASSINVLELNTSGTTQQTISTLFTGSNLLTETGSGTSNGYLNSYNTSLSVPGYNTALTTAGVAALNTKATNILGTGATVINRVVFPTSGSPLPFTANNFRSIIPTSATTFYASGAGSSSTGGIWYYNGTSYTQVSTTQTNTRNVEIFNGNLYYSTGSGTTGIYQVGSGLPTASGQTATLIAAATSPYGFSISPDGNTLYVADDAAVSGNTGGGIQKWTKSGSTWTRQYTFAVQARGITVDYSGNNPVIYATTVVISPIVDNNRIIKIEDTGSSASSSDVLSAGTNYIFRGVDFAPAAAPSAPTIGTLTQTTCASATGSVELTGLPSGQWRIYGFPSGSAVGTGSSTTISGLVAGTYTFIVTSYTGRTSSASASATISTQPGAPGYPTAPTASGQSFCSSASPTVADLTVTSGSLIQWYDASTNGNLIASGTSLTTGTYYASQTVSGCESTTRTSVAVTINSNGTWIGDSNDDWNIAGNWCGDVPNSSSAVVSVPAGVTINLDASTEVSELTLASTSVINVGSNILTIANGGTLTNNGTFNAQTGTVVFAGTGTLAGNATTFNNLTTNGNLILGASQTINGTLTLSSGILTIGANTLSLNGSINRTSGNIDASNASATVVFGGSTAQTIQASTFSGNINNLTLNNSTGLSINQDLSVVGTLSLTSGKLTLGSNHLTLGLNATIGGTSSASNMIIASGDGELRKRFSAANLDAFTFPVGTGTSYTPVVLDFNSGTFGTDAYMRVRVKNEKSSFLNSNVTTYLNRNWIVEPFDITGYSYKVQLHYVDADFVTDGSLAEGNLLPIKISSGQWYQPTDGSFTNAEEQGFAGVFANSNFLEWDGLTTFSEFGGAGGSNQPLPVELLSFNASCVEDQNILTWQTASEHNSSHFDIEKSRDGETWDVIGQQTAAGNSTELLSYQFVDSEKNNSVVYYRLNQVDIDGKNEYFGPVILDCDQNDFEASTLPNPSYGNFWIKIQSNEVSSAKLKLVDVKGDVLLTNDISIQEGINVYPITHVLQTGMYFIHIQNSKDQKITVLKHLQN
jgi:hypothetical protein